MSLQPCYLDVAGSSGSPPVIPEGSFQRTPGTRPHKELNSLSKTYLTIYAQSGKMRCFFRSMVILHSAHLKSPAILWGRHQPAGTPTGTLGALEWIEMIKQCLERSSVRFGARQRSSAKRAFISAVTVMGYVCIAVCIASLNANASSRPVIVAYVFPQDKPLSDGEIAGNKLTRINYAFANIKNGRVVNGFASDDQNLATLVGLKRENPALTVLVSVGGWLWSGGFSDMALTRQNRSVFIESAANYVRRHQLDGIDIDWEYPGLPGATTHFRPEDKQNYTRLLKELRARFDKLEKQLGRPLYITVATGSGDEFLSHTDMRDVANFVDTVNLMAYDYYEPESDAMTGHHAPLFANPSDPKKISGSDSVQAYEKAGVPASKIVLGVPFYAHKWGQVPALNHGLFQPGKQIPHNDATFSTSPQEMLHNGFVRYWDPVADAPYLYNAAEQVFVSYDDPESLTLKCKYVLNHKLGGIMFWDYESDTTGALLDSVDQGLKLDRDAKGGID